MNVLIIEPHGDDALISCISVLMSDVNKNILTLSSRDSAALSEHFSNVTTKYANIEDYHLDNRPLNHHEVRRLHKSGKNSFLIYIQKLYEQEGFLPHVNKIKEYFATQELQNFDLILCPLGLIHPHHIAVRVALDQLNDDANSSLQDKIVYYSEGLYNGKAYGRLLEVDAIKVLTDKLGTITNVVIQHENEEDLWKKKEKIYRKVYPTEVHLFRFSYDDVIKNTEIYRGDPEAVRKLKEALNL